MVGRDREQTNVITLSIRLRSASLGDSQGIDRIDVLRRFDAGDLFPYQALIPIELVPGQLPDLVESILMQGGARAFAVSADGPET